MVTLDETNSTALGSCIRRVVSRVASLLKWSQQAVHSAKGRVADRYRLIRQDMADFNELRKFFGKDHPSPRTFHQETQMTYEASKVVARSWKEAADAQLLKWRVRLSPLKPVGKNTYELSYTLEDKVYKTVVRARRGVRGVCKVYDGKENLTDLVLPYLGPSGKECTVTPAYFDRDRITLETRSGRVIVRSRDERLIA